MTRRVSSLHEEKLSIQALTLFRFQEIGAGLQAIGEHEGVRSQNTQRSVSLIFLTQALLNYQGAG
jgi:hypothetical protein